MIMVETVKGNDAGSINWTSSSKYDDRSILELATVSNDGGSILGLAVDGSDDRSI
jgi:hypothetical protein